ncbi:hypothetical protein DFP72DRAFT_1059813 [Ephemerocybe angulata]|uniref:F-box domain-containing protein n=1 Tax=Ephemerocybe angulata TaxID=980116 RepID=A0A8H6IDX3_9AGAR|nr:hypothetical protein DFP72DRAFT_1059813 [Tulosesus angulatus]
MTDASALPQIEGDIDAQSARDNQLVPSPCPIASVPTEILCKVFSLACASVDIESTSLHLTPSFGPWIPSTPFIHTLIQVCKYWRETAYAQQELWRHFVVIDPQPPNSGREIDSQEIVVYKRQLQEIANVYGSKLTHLHYHVTWIYSPPYLGPPILLDTVLTYLGDRLVSLRLVGDIQPTFTGTETTYLHAPLLEELCLIVTHCAPKNLSYAFRAPKLKKVHLYNPRTEYLLLSFLPWEQLTHLSFGAPNTRAPYTHYVWPLSDVLSMLQQLFNLEYLHFSNTTLFGVTEDQMMDLQSAPIVIPRLRVLEICDRDVQLLCQNGGSIISAISTPVLETLDIMLVFSYINSPSIATSDLVASLQSFLRAHRGLKRVRVGFCGYWVGSQEGPPRTAILKMSGTRQFFRDYNGLQSGAGGPYTLRGTISSRTAELALRGTTYATDHFIDRFMEGEEIQYGGEADQHTLQVGTSLERGLLPEYKATSMARAIIEDILGGTYGVDDGERAFYKFIPT